DTATFLEGVSVYKYLGIIEDSRGIPTRSSFEEVQSKLISRVERLCHTRLNAKNLFSAINQHAISLINYHIGVLRLEPADFSKLDDAVRAVLVKNKIHLRPGCKERLYLPRTELGRGLHSVELRSEHMLLQLLNCLEKSKEISTRRAAILKYRLVEELYNARKNELVSFSDFSRWLKRGNIRPRNEVVFCYIQDRNVFWGADGMYHLATRYEKMLGHDYTRRHNEVIRCLHLLLLNRYKFKSSKRIRSHSVQGILNNEYAEIRVDTRIKTDYDLLANELEIIPYVMTWDGIVTKYHKSHLKRPEKPMNVEAYIQSISGLNAEESLERASMGVIIGAEMHKQPTPLLKEEKREEDGAKTFKLKNKAPLISQGGTTLEEPNNNINKESDLEEETKVVKEVEENI
ncbi:reverse transcriptase, partial [Hamiltosporidium tvaerminnensis]